MESMRSQSRTADALPNYTDWSVAAIRLLQGPIYSDDTSWDSALRYQSPLTDYFARIGLILVVDEPEGMAYLRQLASDEAPDEYQHLPPLFRRTRLGYDATLLCVLLRDELRRFEEEDVDNRRCVIQQLELFETWKTFFSPGEDEVRLQKSLEAALRKLEALHFVNRFGETADSWEIRRILKARLPVAELESLRAQLQQKGSQATTHG